MYSLFFLNFVYCMSLTRACTLSQVYIGLAVCHLHYSHQRCWLVPSKQRFSEVYAIANSSRKVYKEGHWMMMLIAFFAGSCNRKKCSVFIRFFFDLHSHSLSMHPGAITCLGDNRSTDIICVYHTLY